MALRTQLRIACTSSECVAMYSSTDVKSVLAIISSREPLPGGLTGNPERRADIGPADPALAQGFDLLLQHVPHALHGALREFERLQQLRVRHRIPAREG